MSRPRLLSTLLLAAMMIAVAGADTAGPVTFLDVSANPKLYDTHFGRFGPRSTKVVTRENKGGIRLRLPGEPKGAKQTGLYSYFALAGDFEVSADYEVIDIPMPTTGFGAGFGLCVDTEGPDGDVTVRRGQWKGEGSGLQVVRGTKADGEAKYETTFFPTAAKKGRLVLKREKDELILLTAEHPTTQVAELHRVPFVATTIRNVRVFADSGGSPTLVDGRVTNLTVKAAEITGGIPERDRDEFPAWVVVVSVLLAILLGVGIWYFVLRRRGEREEVRKPSPPPKPVAKK